MRFFILSLPTNVKKNNNVNGDYTVPTDIEEITQNTLNDNMQSESELGTKSDHMPNTLWNYIIIYVIVYFYLIFSVRYT